MSPLVLVPAYQAARTITSVVTGLERVVGASIREIVVVDDGSTDDTARLAERAGATVLRHPGNLGKGAALRTGLEHAARCGAGVVVTVDADGQHPAEAAQVVLDHPAPRDALVLGVRDLARDGAPRANRTSNAISNFFVSAFTGQRLLDTQCGLRRYPVERTLALGMRSDGYAFETEVLLRACRAGVPIAQVPVRVYYPPPRERVSHFHAVRDPAKIVGRVIATLVCRGGAR
ncbi:MAG TPA: glycosyltransferase family 2 protein [Polyangiaceae bacterium]|nr:glycosyltransferase family 2 protein [Polyangiaceae bacterium]